LVARLKTISKVIISGTVANRNRKLGGSTLNARAYKRINYPNTPDTLLRGPEFGFAFFY